jgi:hypothetical protein
MNTFCLSGTCELTRDESVAIQGGDAGAVVQAVAPVTTAVILAIAEAVVLVAVETT